MSRNKLTESSLLLQIPKSVDFSGNSFLLPVAANENVPGSQNKSDKDNFVSEKVESSSICQLEQPLLMRKTCSHSDEMASDQAADTQVTSESIQESNFQASALNSSLSNQGTSQIWTSSGSSNSVSSDLQNTQSYFTPSTQLNFTSVASQMLGPEQAVFMNNQTTPSCSIQSSTSSFVGYSSNSASSVPNNFSSYSQQSMFYSNHPELSQPPVITPTTSVVHGNNNKDFVPKYSNVMNQSLDSSHTNSVPAMHGVVYEPVQPYWLFQSIVESKELWCGFSQTDSERLENAYQQDMQAVVPVDGGRYDAFLSERLKKAVYFDAKDLEIRRCTWFYKTDSSLRFTPFPEEAANLLERHYSESVKYNQWQKIVSVSGIGSIVLENPHVIHLYKKDIEYWPPLPDSKATPKVVKRGLPETIELMPNESDRIDHLVFIVQGIGSFCDLRFRTVVECVDGFREIANRLISNHFKYEIDCGRVGRVEFLPLAWHAKLHTSDIGFDCCMQNITLPSIPKLRHFTNDTLLDILLYSSPSYCQTIINTVAFELNKLYELFMKRNNGFSGKIFVAGHSLGSLILFDILANQNLENSNLCDISNTSNVVQDNDKLSKMLSDDSIVAPQDNDEHSIESLLQFLHIEEYVQLFEEEKIDLEAVRLLSDSDLKNMGLPTGPRKKLLNFFGTENLMKHCPENKDTPLDQNQSQQEVPKAHETKPNEAISMMFPFGGSSCMSSIKYPQLHFEPSCFFALGSPISMFLAVRGYDTISDDFRLPTCPSFFHIFHPYDPVAYRIEPLIDPNFSIKPVMIPHHKGRKRMHLEIKENLSKVGYEIKQKVLETLRYTWNSLSGFAKAHTFPMESMEAEVDKLVSEQLAESNYEAQAPSETSGEDIQIGNLNGGRRIDYVLQEKPIEALNDYIFALTSHSTYWDSEDTVLMILREIYALQGIVVSQSLDSRQFPQLESVPSRSFDNLHVKVNSNQDVQNKNLNTGAPLFGNQSRPPMASTIGSSSNIAAGMSQISGSVLFTSEPSAPSVLPPQSNAATSAVPSVPPPCATSNQLVGPPPLTGFVKRSPFAK